MNSTRTSMARRTRRGFSLLEVLIAVVVLSVGLLALAALQAALIRSSGETKAQTTGLSMAEERLECMRAFQSLDAYRQLASIAEADADTVSADKCDRDVATLGGTSFTRWQDVTRYVFDTSTGEFVAVSDALVDATDDQLVAANANLRPGTEFKRIEVHVGWTDATGADRTITLLDTLSATDPADSSRVLSKPPGGPRRPQALIYNPAMESGVIPIAIGSGSETAATNPRPEVVGQGNSSTVVETRFDVLTYAALSDNANLAQAQSRIETALVGCSCTYGSPAAAPAFRPTYWNGFRYAAPDTATYNPPAGPRTGQGNNAITQSTLCTQCCRDHHDPAGVLAPKFDPLRDTHSHFLDIADEAVTTGTYRESCRIIRVDGILRVAADMNMEYFGLLATDDGAESPVPADAAGEAYEQFVLTYLDERFVSGTAYNTVNTARAETIADGIGLNNPAQIGLEKPVSGTDPRWLHGRGVYIDFMEVDARARIDEEKAKCEDPDALDECVLPFVPFTTINLTELARWSSYDTPVADPRTDTQIFVTNNTDTIFGDPDDPVRGKVTARSSAVDGQTGDALAALGMSNAAIALFGAIDPDDAVDLSDTQEFLIGTVASTGDEFSVRIGGGLELTAGNFPAVGYAVGLIDAADCSAAPSNENPNPYACPTNSTLGVPASVVLKNYNRIGFRLGDNPCTTNKTETDEQIEYCVMYDVLSATNALGETADLTTVNDGFLSEVTRAAFQLPASIAADDVINVQFSTQTRIPGGNSIPSYTCDGPGNKNVNWILVCE